jgi:hypothetical protein
MLKMNWQILSAGAKYRGIQKIIKVCIASSAFGYHGARQEILQAHLPRALISTFHTPQMHGINYASLWLTLLPVGLKSNNMMRSPTSSSPEICIWNYRW